MTRIDSKRQKMMEKAAQAVASIGIPQCGVLIVEDDPDLQWRLARTLTVEGHRVVGTSSGDGALALVAQWPVDLVLVDEALPGMSGLEVAERIHAEHPSIPVVMMSCSDDPEFEAAARSAGASACIAKPFTPKAVREVMRELAPEVSVSTPAE